MTRDNFIKLLHFANIILSLHLISCIGIHSYDCTTERFPTGYIFVNYSNGDVPEWRIKDENLYLHIKEDFNGDGIPDEAMLLQKIDQKEIALFVFLSNKISEQKVFKLFESNDANSKNYHGITAVKPGKYLTAKGKGYGRGRSTGDTIIIENHAINLFMVEGGRRFFIWEDSKNTFRSVWISD